MPLRAFRLRPIRRDDLGELAILCAEHAVYEGAGDLPEGREERLRRLLFDPEPCLHGLVVERGRQLVGFATWTRQVSTWDAAPYLYLDCLFLRPAARNQGIGLELVEAVAQAAKASGCAQVQWQTPTENVGAIRFYDRLGARPRSKVRYSLDGDALAALQSSTSHA